MGVLVFGGGFYFGAGSKLVGLVAFLVMLFWGFFFSVSVCSSWVSASASWGLGLLAVFAVRGFSVGGLGAVAYLRRLPYTLCFLFLPRLCLSFTSLS